MRFAVPLAAMILATAAVFPAGRAQAPAAVMEELKRMSGEIEDLREAFNAQQRKIAELQTQNDALRVALRESSDKNTTRLADFVTRDDLRKMADKMQEIDQKRESDKNLILEELKKLGQTLAATPAPAPAPSSTSRSNRDRRTTEAAQETKEGTFYPHKVESGETLSAIVAAYNAAFKEKGKGTITLDMVRKANPRININNIYAGQEILIPEPADKR